ncbi:hypothetical protein [Halorussus caseinilyticus]|uniref:Uncharacterized protein n=1 Tax=Halorussus caseinilyticus TaxID=3034025 RepID=A0ABD5WU13_9EURY
MSTDAETRSGDAPAPTRTTDSADERLVGRIGTGTAILAVCSVQLVAFAAALAVGYPGAYAGFAVVSAGAIAAYRNRGAFGVLAATLGTVLLVALGLPC